VLAMALFACSSASPAIYTIAPVNGAEQQTAPKVILLRQWGLQRYLESSQIARSPENYQLDMMENETTIPKRAYHGQFDTFDIMCTEAFARIGATNDFVTSRTDLQCSGRSETFLIMRFA
jgi:hypothetical protein